MTSRRIPGFAMPAALLLVFFLAGCSSSGGGRAGGSDPFGGGAGSRGSGSGEIRIRVRNQNFNEATITALGPGVRRRIGRVGGAEQATFTLAWAGSNRLYFEIDILGGDRCTTPSVDVAAGETVQLEIDSMARARQDGRRRLCDLRRAR